MLARQMEPERSEAEGEYSRDRSELIRERIELSSKLLAKAQHLKHGAGIKGFQRIERKIKAEKNFLESVRRPLPLKLQETYDQKQRSYM